MPRGFLALMLGGLGLLVRRSPTIDHREAFLLFVPALLIMVGVSSQTGFNHYVRYPMPAMPFLIVGASLFAAAVVGAS